MCYHGGGQLLLSVKGALHTWGNDSEEPCIKGSGEIGCVLSDRDRQTVLPANEDAR